MFVGLYTNKIMIIVLLQKYFFVFSSDYLKHYPINFNPYCYNYVILLSSHFIVRKS